MLRIGVTNTKINYMDQKLTPKLKLFGLSASRVTTQEMNNVFIELKSILDVKFNKFKLSKPLPEKQDHGDIDIVIESTNFNDDITFIKNTLSSFILQVVHNGPILHVLLKSKSINKDVHVDFIFATPHDFESTLMYLAYNDFSGILGVVARKLKFNYASNGFYKIYVDSKGQHNYILLSNSLVDGLIMLGYGSRLYEYIEIQNILDVAKFISSSDLFSSDYLFGADLNRGDKKRMRSGRASACEIRNTLISYLKERTQPDDDFYIKEKFPYLYKMYLDRCKQIEDAYLLAPKKYSGYFIMEKFPQISKGPIVGEILKHLSVTYGTTIDEIDEPEVIKTISSYLDAR